MFQKLLEDTYKNKAQVDKADLDYNLSRGMFYLALSQIHLSGAIGNVLEDGHEEMAKAILRAVTAINKIYVPADASLNYNTFIPDLVSMISVIDKIAAHSNFLERIECLVDGEIEAIKKEFLDAKQRSA